MFITKNSLEISISNAASTFGQYIGKKKKTGM